MAMAMETGNIRSGVIGVFSGEYRFLSNFWPCWIEYDGRVYKSVEHAYQAAKTLDESQRKYIQMQCSTPGQAKRYGRRVNMRPDWDEIKLSVMYDLLLLKFAEGELRERLTATGNAELIEGNHWGDYYWGKCMGVGENRLGELLMLVRRELR